MAAGRQQVAIIDSLASMLLHALQGTVDLAKYTLDTYMRIVTYKTAYYSFYLPIACGMLLAGIQVW
jgi:geranylgeranyl pyrophosphate synthase